MDKAVPITLDDGEDIFKVIPILEDNYIKDKEKMYTGTGIHKDDFKVFLNDMEIDIVNGLETGADDYITKPFSLAVLRARVNTQLRRGSSTNDAVFTANRYSFDFTKMIFKVDEECVELSKTEQKLLKILTDNSPNTVKRDTLMDRIWTDGAEYVDENALSVTVKRLRDKLDAHECIKTVYGIGYVWK
mgnify:CR=1 FL=1